eukprot:5611950-Prymnesium_polylepis.1
MAYDLSGAAVLLADPSVGSQSAPPGSSGPAANASGNASSSGSSNSTVPTPPAPPPPVQRAVRMRAELRFGWPLRGFERCSGAECEAQQEEKLRQWVESEVPVHPNPNPNPDPDPNPAVGRERSAGSP